MRQSPENPSESHLDTQIEDQDLCQNEGPEVTGHQASPITYRDTYPWGHVGVDLGSIWGRIVVDLGSVWGRFGVDLGSIWGDLNRFESIWHRP